MNLLMLVWNYLKFKPVSTALNVFMLALGIAVITLLLLFNNQMQAKIGENTKGIDLVVGAKGSPLQLILCNIFHVDFPTGNIKLAEAERIARNGLIKKAIPLALGDSYTRFRIIGTSKDYVELYHLKLDAGAWWNAPLEATVGANVASLLKLKVGDHFSGAHGLSGDGHSHEQEYTIKGIIRHGGTVVDNLILTGVESVWMVHEEHEETNEHHEGHQLHDSVSRPLHPSRLVASVESGDTTKEITSLLIQYRSPLGALQLPRKINSESNMQAASPAFETARLFSILGVGVDILNAFAYVIIFISALSIFIALYNALRERRYDLAIMRAMGASRSKILWSVLLEGTLTTLGGTVAGITVGHVMLLIFSIIVPEGNQAGFDAYIFYKEELWLIVTSLMIGLVSAAIPAIQAYRTDIHGVLAGE